jgi:hypothetical protein
MNEYLLEAREELKRLEHILYVSLKYSRTVDVITNALDRLVSIFDLIIEAHLEKAKKEGLIESLPKSPALRGNILADIYSDDKEMQKYLTFYSFLKKILKLPFEKRQEFRRHVTRIVDLGNATAEVKIDNLMNCEKFVHKFFNYSKGLILGVKEEDD